MTHAVFGSIVHTNVPHSDLFFYYLFGFYSVRYLFLIRILKTNNTPTLSVLLRMLQVFMAFATSLVCVCVCS